MLFEKPFPARRGPFLSRILLTLIGVVNVLPDLHSNCKYQSYMQQVIGFQNARDY
jgi:hypothetical protein